MKKIVALAFGICLMGGAVSAQTLDSKYGLDSVNWSIKWDAKSCFSPEAWE